MVQTRERTRVLVTCFELHSHCWDPAGDILPRTLSTHLPSNHASMTQTLMLTAGLPSIVSDTNWLSCTCLFQASVIDWTNVARELSMWAELSMFAFQPCMCFLANLWQATPTFFRIWSLQSRLTRIELFAFWMWNKRVVYVNKNISLLHKHSTRALLAFHPCMWFLGNQWQDTPTFFRIWCFDSGFPFSRAIHRLSGLHFECETNVLFT